MSETEPAPNTDSTSLHDPEPSSADAVDLDATAEAALAGLAARFAAASGTVQELFDDYTRQAARLSSGHR